MAMVYRLGRMMINIKVNIKMDWNMDRVMINLEMEINTSDNIVMESLMDMDTLNAMMVVNTPDNFLKGWNTVMAFKSYYKVSIKDNLDLIKKKDLEI